MSKHKYVTYKNNNYDINYTRIQEKCPNGKIENRISIILHNNKALPKSYYQIFENDDTNIEEMVKYTIDKYLDEYTEVLSITQKFEYWNGNLDEYQG